MSELKPCPFCGGKNIRLTGGDDMYDYSITCWTCDFDGPPEKTKEAAIAAWNRREEEENDQ